MWLLLAAGEAAQIRIIKESGRYQLLRDGKPYFTRGAVGSVHLEDLAAAGGNSIRARVEDLDRAQSLGLTVLANLPFGKQRTGFDYSDAAAVEKQRERIRSIVEQHRRHPALLAWSVGNELEIRTTAEQRAVLWKELNRVARMIHQVDPDHPVITPIGDAYRRMLHELNEHCPDLDAVGLNSYIDMLKLPEDIAREGWTRPYWVTEFGPRGHWQVARTPWKLPVEDTSSQKADFYRRAYLHAVAGQPACLGSYVFHWAQHHEKTHTWYGMFLEDGSRTEAVDVMTNLWTGKWPANRAPAIGRITLHSGGVSTQDPVELAPGAMVQLHVDANDPESDALAFTWDVRADVSGNPNVGGDREEPTPALITIEGRRTKLAMPDREGAFRIFVYVSDGRGSAATANLPVLLKRP